MKVCIREILETVVEVNSIEEAEAMYNRCEIVLEPDDLKCVEFTEYTEE